MRILIFRCRESAEPADDDPYRHRREVRWLSTIEKTAALDMATRFRGTLGRVLGDRQETVLAAFSVSQAWLGFEEDSDVAPTDMTPVPTQDDGRARADRAQRAQLDGQPSESSSSCSGIQDRQVDDGCGRRVGIDRRRLAHRVRGEVR